MRINNFFFDAKSKLDKIFFNTDAAFKFNKLI